MLRLRRMFTICVCLTITAISVGCSSSQGPSGQDPSTLSISAVNPNSGADSGDYLATISGSNFQSGATVVFGSAASQSVTVVSSSELQAKVPSGSPGMVDVAVSNPDGQKAVLHNAFAYHGPAPTISNLSPTSGPTTGGTVITVNGSHFSSGASVLFGSLPATSVTVANANQLQATTPAHSSGSVDVTVTNSDGQSGTLASGFQYNSSAPSISGISPTSGPTTGGTTVSITGLHFATGALVFFGAVAATGVAVNGSTQIQAVTPAVSSAAAVDVVVQNPDGESGKLVGGFTYTGSSPSGSPAISGISPNSATAGTVVDVDGTSFASGASVSFGSNAASSVKFLSDTELAVTVPTISPGTYDLTVTNPSGASTTSSSAFTVTTAQSLLAGMTPSNLKVPSGWSVVLTQDFESGSLPKTQSIGDPKNSSITTANPHTGSHSEQCRIAWDGATCELNWLPGAISYSDIYVSFWRYMDAAARGDLEIYFARLYGTGQDVTMDTQNYQDSYGVTHMTAQFFAGSNSGGVNWADPNGTGTWDLPLGQWEQVEVWIHPNTCSGGVANKDGFYRLYINGRKVSGNSNVNMNGCQQMSGSSDFKLTAGGVFTYMIWKNSSGQCVDRQNHSGATQVSCNPGSTCPTVQADGTTPCVNYGPFNVYLDDVIIMKK